MADRAQSRRAGPSRTTGDGSSRLAARLEGFRAASGFAVGVSALGALAGLLLVVGEFTTVASVDVASGSCDVITESDPELADRCRLSGFERHGGAFLLLGLLSFAMAWGAGVGGSRPAAAALLAVGVLVLFWGLVFDVPEASETGAIGPRYQGAKASPGIALFLELAAGLLAVAASGLRLFWEERFEG